MKLDDLKTVTVIALSLGNVRSLLLQRQFPISISIFKYILIIILVLHMIRIMMISTVSFTNNDSHYL